MSPKVSDAHREGKRKEILEAAACVFIRQGYHAATMKDVVEESGLSRGGVYLYFGSTEEMFLAMLEEMDQENHNQVETLLAQYPNVWDALDAMFDHLQEELAHVREGMIPVVLEALIGEWRKQTYQALMEVRYELAITRILQLLQVGLDRGEFRPIVPLDTIARMFITLNDGMMLDAAQFGSEKMKTREQAMAFRLSLRLLLGVTIEEEGR